MSTKTKVLTTVAVGALALGALAAGAAADDGDAGMMSGESWESMQSMHPMHPMHDRMFPAMTAGDGFDHAAHHRTGSRPAPIPRS